MLKNILSFFAFLLLLGCNGSSPETTDTTAVSQSGTAAAQRVLVLSQAPTEAVSSDDLCTVAFEPSTLYPTENDPNKRYFNLVSGKTYVMVVTAGNSRTSFMLQQHQQAVQLYASTQYPSCLSNIAHFRPNEAGDGFYYDAGKYTTFYFRVVPNGSGFRAEINWDAGKELGMYVRERKM